MFVHCMRTLFCLSVCMWGIHLAQIFLVFKLRLRIAWAATKLPTITAICTALCLASVTSTSFTLAHSLANASIFGRRPFGASSVESNPFSINCRIKTCQYVSLIRTYFIKNVFTPYAKRILIPILTAYSDLLPTFFLLIYTSSQCLSSDRQLT